MNYIIRPEQPQDFPAVERLTYEAFRTMARGDGQGQANEHLLVHRLRRHPGFVPDLDLVAAEESGRIVGHILYAKIAVVQANGAKTELLTFGPLSVAPALQRQGIGGALVCESLKRAKALGYKGVIIFGHPTYYPRFGFVEAGTFGITTQEGDHFPAFMARELYPGALKGMAGRVVLPDVYTDTMDEKELASFTNALLEKTADDDSWA